MSENRAGSVPPGHEAPEAEREIEMELLRHEVEAAIAEALAEDAP